MSFKSKADVDKYAECVISRSKSESEANTQSLKIAQLYFQIHEYNGCQKYLSKYLSEYTQDASAWKLMGELAEKDSSHAKAIEYYTQSLKLNESQNKKLLVSICRCYLAVYDNTKKIDWTNGMVKLLARAESAFPSDVHVVKLKELQVEHQVEQISEDRTKERLLIYQKWESYLVKCLEQHPNSELLNITLIKLYMKLSKFEALDNQFVTPSLLKALNRVLVNDIDLPTFDEAGADNSYYNELLRSFEPQSESYFVTLTRLLITQRLLALSLRKSRVSAEKTLRLFRDYNELLATLEETASITKFDRSMHKCFMEELRSHLYFFTGLILLIEDGERAKSESQLLDLMADDPNDKSSLLDNDFIIAVICYLNSISLSKPNNSMFTSKANTPISSRKVDSNQLSNLALKCTARDSAWRYSIISSWLKFKLTTVSNKSTLYRRLCELSSNKNFASIIKSKLEKLSATSNDRHTSFSSKFMESFKIEIKNLNTKNSSSVFSFIDRQTLEHAEKIILINQKSNLNYLVWHTLANSIVKDSEYTAKTGRESKFKRLVFPYTDTHQTSRTVKFGVDNLNLCNPESLSLLDLKVFLYSTAIQAWSYLDEHSLMPYWFHHSDLSRPYQSTSWQQAISYLNEPATDQSNKPDRNTQLVEISRILEQTRLKAVKNPNEPKLNTIIAIQMAFYLQTLVDSVESNSRMARLKYEPNASQIWNESSNLDLTGETGTRQSSVADEEEAMFVKPFLTNQCESRYSPLEKMEQLKRYAVHYWSFLWKRSITRESSRPAFTLLSQYDADNDELSNDQTLDSSRLSSKGASKSYFNFSHKKFSSAEKSENVDHLIDEDLLMTTSLLQLTANSLKFDQTMDNETSLLAQIDAALARFKQSLAFDIKQLELNAYQLKLCDQIENQIVSLDGQLNSSRSKSQVQIEILKRLDQFTESFASYTSSFKNHRSILLTPVKSVEKPIEKVPDETKKSSNENFELETPVRPVVKEPVQIVLEPSPETATEKTESLEVKSIEREQTAPQVEPSEATNQKETTLEEPELPPNPRILELIRIIKEERAESRFKFSLEKLKQQFHNINTQFDQLNLETKFLGQAARKRMTILEEFNSLVSSFNSLLIENERKNAEFLNILFWLFLNNPNLIRQHGNQF